MIESIIKFKERLINSINGNKYILTIVDFLFSTLIAISVSAILAKVGGILLTPTLKMINTENYVNVRAIIELVLTFVFYLELLYITFRTDWGDK